jgi:hypothetical protein
VDYIDGTETASYTFQVYDFPDRLYLGKNSFKILANSNYLLNNAPILIDIEDSNGNPVYYEITNLINRDRSRTIVIFIYDDTPIGKCTIYIASRLKRSTLNGDAIPSDNDTAINVMWKKEILVSTSQITSEPIIFSNPPIIQFSERLEPRRYFSGTGSRYNVRENRGSGTITLGGTAQNLFVGAVPTCGFEVSNPGTASLWISKQGDLSVAGFWVLGQ